MERNFEKLLNLLGTSFGKDMIASKGDHSACVSIDGEFLSMEYNSGDDSVFLFAIVSPVPQRMVHLIYAEILDANVLFHKTSGFTLAASPVIGITLQSRHGLCEFCDLKTLDLLLKKFIATVKQWRKICQQMESEGLERESSINQDILASGMLMV